MGSRLRCCNCPKRCLNHGQSFAACGVESGEFYGIGQASCETVVDAVDGILPGDYLHAEGVGVAGICVSGTACEWRDNDGSPDYEWSLFICSTTEAYVYLYLPNRTTPTNVIVWVADLPRYDPLCDSIFTYDPDHADNNPPGTGGWPRQLCVIPYLSCCDYERVEPMPDELDAEVTYCCGDDCGLTAQFKMVWVPGNGRWEGGATLCDGNVATFWLACKCAGVETGCGGPGGYCYEAEMTYRGITDKQDVEVCVCEPFEVVVTFATMMADAETCAVECSSASTFSAWEPL